jgi:tetratricopeptide (TPR) repeat protein
MCPDMYRIFKLTLPLFILAPLLFACATPEQSAKQETNPQTIPETVLYVCESGPDVNPRWGRRAAQSVMLEGWKNVENKNGEKAAQLFLSALLIGPERPDAYWGLGVASHVAGFTTETMKTCFDMAVKKLPDVSNLYTDYGLALLERDQLNEAVSTLQKALELDSNNLLAHVWMSKVYVKLGDDEKAQYHLETAEKLEESLKK